MSQLVIEHGTEKQNVAAPTLPIRTTAAEPLPPANPDPAQLYFRPFGSHRQNSRASRALPKGAWTTRWKADLDPAFTPVHVIEGKDRIIVQSSEWRLFDRDGHLIAHNRAGSAPMMIDSNVGMFYFINPDSYLVAYRLATGEPYFKFLPAYGDTFSRIHIARRGSRMAIVGVERALDPHGVREPERSLIEVDELGLPPKVHALGFLTSLARVGVLRIPNPNFAAASSDKMIVGASPGSVYIVEWDAVPRLVLESNMNPQAISIDEAERIYLTGEAGGQASLWQIKPDGARLYAFDLPAGSEVPKTPAIVGYDHTAYVLSGHQIFAVAANGKQLWMKTAAQTISGAVITADGLLISAEGNEVAVYDAKGIRTVLFHGETFLTPPVLSATGELFVASKTSLYCLAAH